MNHDASKDSLPYDLDVENDRAYFSMVQIHNDAVFSDRKTTVKMILMLIIDVFWNSLKPQVAVVVMTMKEYVVDQFECVDHHLHHGYPLHLHCLPHAKNPLDQWQQPQKYCKY